MGNCTYKIQEKYDLLVAINCFKTHKVFLNSASDFCLHEYLSKFQFL